MRIHCICLLVCLKLIDISLAESFSRISVKDEWMVDDKGRVRIFHGINSVKKGKPWYDDQILNVTRLKLYKEWGFNAVRLGAMWAGLEPEEGRIDQSYVDILTDIVKKTADHGIYSLLDMHQDVFSSTVCDTSTCYDGIPDWVCSKFEPSPHKYPWPFKSITEDNWALGYLSQSVSVAFQQLYDNVGGAMDAMVRFWVTIAKLFKDQKSVLGYDLINEPWAGNIFERPWLLLPGVAGAKNLIPMYNRLYDEIDKVDPETLFFYEPVTWGVYLHGDKVGTGFEKLPGSKDFRSRSVMSYHHYCWLLNLVNVSSNYPTYLRVVCDKVIGTKVIPAVMKDIKKTGGSSFLTEFGLCETDSNPQSINTIECDFIMSEADKYIQSWVYWDSLFFDANGNVKTAAVKGFARPYARAIAGLPLKTQFNAKTRVFHFEYAADDQIDAPTEVFLPKLQYDKEIKFDISDNAEWSFDPESSILLLKHKPDTPMSVSVTIRPKN